MITKLIQRIDNSKYRYIGYFLTGLFSSLAFAPIFFTLALLPLFLLYTYSIRFESNLKKLFLSNLLMFLGHFMGGCYWICISLTIDLKSHFWLIPFALTLLPAYLALYPTLTAVLSKRFQPSYVAFTIGFACVWTLMEVLREFIITGFPWNALGYVWANNIYFSQIASITGIYGLSFITIVIFTLITISITEFKLLPLIISIVIFIGNISFGYNRLKTEEVKYLDTKVLVVQANISQQLKWKADEKMNNVIKHLKLSRMASKGDVIIWPESAFGYLVSLQDRFASNISGVIPENGFLITGALRFHQENEKDDLKLWNSLIVISNDGYVFDYYDKRHLVPFAEYIPLSKYINLTKITDGQIDFLEGEPTRTLVSLDKGRKFIPLICYESIFPHQNFERINQANFIVMITNDGWFGNSSGPYQHFYMSRIRAIEAGKPLIRAANTGISAVIDGYGRILKQTKLNTEDVIYTNIPQEISKPTYFAQEMNKNKITSILTYLLFIVIIGNAIIKRKKSL
ncbi:MAG: apolipoprotein N-acyltransferase [Sphingobacteriia bacterium]|nr:apolipoprotein N-acyltransferase [Sphingobacteriia bacterium]